MYEDKNRDRGLFFCTYSQTCERKRLPTDKIMNIIRNIKNKKKWEEKEENKRKEKKYGHMT